MLQSMFEQNTRKKFCVDLLTFSICVCKIKIALSPNKGWEVMYEIVIAELLILSVFSLASLKRSLFDRQEDMP